jgi:hypothetical protein
MANSIGRTRENMINSPVRRCCVISAAQKNACGLVLVYDGLRNKITV